MFGNTKGENTDFLRKQIVNVNRKVDKLTDKQKDNAKTIRILSEECSKQKIIIDSLHSICNQMKEAQLVAHKNINNKIYKTNNKVLLNQYILQSRTFWACVMVVVLLIVIIRVTYRLTKRIKSGDSSIDDVRKAQDALQAAQGKMQEEAIKLEDKLLALFNKQLSNTPKVVGNEKPDHSLALKVADEIVRIELNMARMDASIKGYKQLAKAVERIKDNFKANGYEIVDMLGKPYNEGMKVTANFVVDEDLEEGKQIITGITKPQINYNGQMIQAAQITVSQNI